MAIFTFIYSSHASQSYNPLVDISTQTDDRFKHRLRINIEASRLNLRNARKGSLPKVLRASFLSLSYNLTISAGLFMLPEHVTHWKRENFFRMAGPNIKRAWTRKPVWDRDGFLVNYIGHPYQGSYYYNTMRSQGAKIWESALFCTGQTLIWEFGYEALKERPSRQDLITTPLGGIILGELSHRATIIMHRRGFNLWEKIAVTLINPSYVLNNGYR